MVTDANLFTRDDSADLTKERSEPEFMIGYTYKFKVFKLSPTLFFYRLLLRVQPLSTRRTASTQ